MRRKQNYIALICLCFILSIISAYSCRGEQKPYDRNATTSHVLQDTSKQAQKARKDSLNRVKAEQQKQQELDEFLASPQITTEEVATIKPVIKDWLDFYKIDLSQARLTKRDSFCFRCPVDTNAFYYQPYSQEQDSPGFPQMFYSPNKQRYIDIGISCHRINGKYYEGGDYDDSQSGYLTDRKRKQNLNLFYFGLSAGVDAAFWKNNEEFVLVGRNTGNYLEINFVWVYNIPKQTRVCYSLQMSDDFPRGYWQHILKRKGILPWQEQQK